MINEKVVKKRAEIINILKNPNVRSDLNLESTETVGECIGSGTTGCVFKIKNNDLNQDTGKVIKYVGPSDTSEHFKELQEIEVIKDVGDALTRSTTEDEIRIVKTFGVHIDSNDRFYIICMKQYSPLMNEENKIDERLYEWFLNKPDEASRKLALDISVALNWLHEKGYVHRDVKPGNIFWYNDPSDNSIRFVLGDFDICRKIAQDKVANTICGSNGYCPAHWMSELIIERDIYGLGATIYYMLDIEREKENVTERNLKYVPGEIVPGKPRLEPKRGSKKLKSIIMKSIIPYNEETVKNINLNFGKNYEVYSNIKEFADDIRKINCGDGISSNSVKTSQSAVDISFIENIKNKEFSKEFSGLEGKWEKINRQYNDGDYIECILAIGVATEQIARYLYKIKKDDECPTDWKDVLKGLRNEISKPLRDILYELKNGRNSGSHNPGINSNTLLGQDRDETKRLAGEMMGCFPKMIGLVDDCLQSEVTKLYIISVKGRLKAVFTIPEKYKNDKYTIKWFTESGEYKGQGAVYVINVLKDMNCCLYFKISIKNKAGESHFIGQSDPYGPISNNDFPNNRNKKTEAKTNNGSKSEKSRALDLSKEFSGEDSANNEPPFEENLADVGNIKADANKLADKKVEQKLSEECNSKPTIDGKESVDSSKKKSEIYKMKFTRNSEGYTFIRSKDTTAVSIVVPEYFQGEKVTRIAGNAFEDHSNLTNIELPSSITRIGSFAFYGCSKLKTVYVSDIAKWVEIEFKSPSGNPMLYANDLYVNGSLYYSKNKNETFELPEGIERIGDCAFFNFHNLKSIEIPSSVVSIGRAAFLGCSNLTSIEIPNSVRYIGEGVFMGCDRLASISLPFVGPYRDANETSEGTLAYVFHKSKSIPKTLKSVKITDTYQIPTGAFEECDGLTNVEMSGGVISVGERAFGECRGLTSIKIPDGVTNIGEFAFCGCTRLTSVEIPNSVRYIGEGVFMGCDRLVSISLPFAGLNRDVNENEDEILSYVFNKIRPKTLKNVVITDDPQITNERCNVLKRNIIMVDIGGSSVRIGKVENGTIIDDNIQKVNVNNKDELVTEIMIFNNGEKPDAIGVSVAGFVDARRGYVRLSGVASWSEGCLAQYIKDKTGAGEVIVVNDGEAHSMAMLSDTRVEYGAVCLSLGTAVGLGIIDENRNVLRSLSGENWDIGEIQLKTKASDQHIWWCLGSEGLAELTNSMGEEGYSHYGYRLGFFLSQLSIVFMPRTIALTGEIIHSDHQQQILEALKEELLRRIPSYMECPDVIVLEDKETALIGLTNCIDGVLF